MATGVHGVTSRAARSPAGLVFRRGNAIATTRPRPETELTAPSTEARPPKRSLANFRRAPVDPVSKTRFLCRRR